jgi:hypothetical protein
MKKYFVLFRIPVESMDQWMKSGTPEERKKQSDVVMQDWPKWMEKHASAIVDKGSPLGKTKTVTKDGIKDSRNDLNYFMIIQADSHDEAAKVITDNPHLQIPTSFVDVIEIPHMGM